MMMLRRPLLLGLRSGRATTGSLTRGGVDDFFDNVTKPGEKPLTGRPWCARELRLKSFQDLHKLWFVLLKERNKLLTERAHVEPGKSMAAPERVRKVKASMAAVMHVLGERQRLRKVEHLVESAKTPQMKKFLRDRITELKTVTGTPLIPKLFDPTAPQQYFKEFEKKPSDKTWNLSKTRKLKDPQSGTAVPLITTSKDNQTDTSTAQT